MNQNPRALRLLLAAGALVIAAAWAPGALAYTANVMATVNLRAGPSTEYPVVATMRAGAVVEVYGCEQNYGWCDAQVGPDRGWVDAAYLQMGAPSGPVIVADSGVVLGLPIVAFTFGTYWDRWYRGRPWYSRRPYYYNYWNRYPHGRPPPPPHMRPPILPPRPPAVRPPRPRPPGHRPPYRPPDAGRPPLRPPGNGRPPGDGRPPGGKPPGIGQPPNNGRPGTPGNWRPGADRPPPTPKPAPGSPQP